MELTEEEKTKQLRDIMNTLTEGVLFNLRPAHFLMRGAGGIGQPDEVAFIGSKYVGKDQKSEEQLWGYINSLPTYFKEAVEGYFGYIKDEYTPDLELVQENFYKYPGEIDFRKE